MNVLMELDFGDWGVRRSREPCNVSQQMDFSRGSGRIGENAVTAKLCSPGPATPVQVAPLPPQKPREATALCPSNATTVVTHSFEAAKTICELQLASETPTSACTQSETENGQLLTASNECSVAGSQALETVSSLLGAVKHGVGPPSDSGVLATRVGPTKALLKDEVEAQVGLKSSEEEVSMPSCGAIERPCSDGSMTSMSHPSSSVKAESAGFALDAGLSLGSNAVQFSGLKERASVEFSRAWENVGGSGGRCGDSYVGSSREEGAVVLQLSQGMGVNAGDKGEMGMGDEWQGKHLELSFGLEAEEKVEGGRVDGKVEPNLRQVVEENAGVSVEDVAKDCRDSSDDRLTKRVKREAMERSVEESREQIWERNEDQDGSRSGTHENKEDFKSLFLCNGGAALLPQSYRERALGKVVELGSGEPKTVVVKKTPKRVHNSDPSAMFSRSELLMFEDSMRSPGSVPRVMFTPSNKQGMNGTMLASDLVNSASHHLYRKSANSVCGREKGVEHSNGVPQGSSVLQSQSESRLDSVSSCSLMSTSKHALLMSESSLPFNLNFSPKAQRPVVSISRTSTEEEWGKSLALCGPGAESPVDLERCGEEANALSYQERFVQLQVFLKKCDEDDQSDLLDGLRSLSAAGRSSHAVGLEQRALWLSIEEGKEMTRLKSLNVMGQRSSMRGQSEVGCTAEGRGVASLGSGAECAQQQSLTNMRCPQMQMKMPVSGPMAGSGYKESYRSG